MSNVVSFDGIDGTGVNLGAGASLDLRNAITICVRVKRGVKNIEEYVIASDQCMIALLGTTWYWYTIGTTNDFMGIGFVPPIGSWCHIATSYDKDAGANNKKTYRDGNRIGQVTAINAMPAPATNKFLGRYYTSAIYALQSLMAEVQIYNRQLSDDEILYNNSHPNNPKRRGLVLNLTQDSIYGPTWLDLSGNANNGTYVGGAVPQVANRLSGR